MPETMQPEGNYWATVKYATTSFSRNNKPQMVVTFDITDREVEDGDPIHLVEPHNGRVYISLSDAAMEFAEKKLGALEFNGDFNEPDFGVKSLWLECTHDNFTGSLKEKWDIPGTNSGGEIKKADEGTIMQLGAKWRARTQAPVPAGAPSPVPAAAQTTATAAPPPPPESRPPRGDEIPFDGSTPAPPA